MESSKQYYKQANSALSIADDQLMCQVKNGEKCLHDVYVAYCKALRARKFKRVDVIDFWLAEREGEDHEFFIKKNVPKSKKIK